jgi:sugar/nucleoside kinase (ribokinase family)
MTSIGFVGHVCIDRNVVRGVDHTLYGGGVVHGAITAQRLLPGGVSVVTKCAPADRIRWDELSRSGVDIVFLASETSTSIRNVYPSDDPDDRQSTLIALAAPFTAEELSALRLDILHLNPLTRGELPLELLPAARDSTRVLGCDAQGLLRVADTTGRCQYRDLPDKASVLALFDLLKVDLKEASFLTGLPEPRPAAARLHDLGAKLVLLTHAGGVCVHGDAGVVEAPFAAVTLEGRTGRGDTCTAAFLTAHFRQGRSLEDSARLAAEVTSRKMQYKGPYRG